MLPETKHEKTEVKVLFATGLGFGEGSVSIRERLHKGEVSHEGMAAAVDIVQNDPRVWVDVDADDDGCGDGRGTKRIYRFLDKATGAIEIFKRSLRRAKLFGGGLVAASSMWRAVDGKPEAGKTLKGDRDFVSRELDERGVHYGAHTDDHAEGEACGCGAIDKYTDVSANVVKYREPILAKLEVLYGPAFKDNEEAVTDVLDMYAELPEEYSAGVTGKSTMEDIEEDGAVVKQLGGKHLEGIDVLNDVEGTTLDQEMLATLLRERGISEEIQAFVVDVWRGRMYADLIADVAEKNGHEREKAYKRAYADFLIRTLAVSGTLTKGDQPVLYRAAA